MAPRAKKRASEAQDPSVGVHGWSPGSQPKCFMFFVFLRIAQSIIYCFCLGIENLNL
jgi:hypothetical protein